MTAAREGRRPRSRDRRQQAAVAILAALAGLVAAISGTPRVPADATEKSGDAGDPTVTTTAEFPARAWLLAHKAGDGRVDLLAVVGTDTGGKAGAAVLVPTATVVEVPSLGSQTFADIARLSSSRLFLISVQNALGIRFQDVMIFDDDELAAALAPAVAFDVEFRRGVRIDDDAGTLTFQTGVVEVEAAEAMRLLAAPPGAKELVHLVTVRAVLEGWRAALRDNAVASATTAAVGAAKPLVESADAQLHYETLPVESISQGGDERFRIRRDDATAMLRDAIPWTLLGGGRPRPRVEVLNGTGGVGVTEAIAALVVPAGGEITLTGNVPDFGVEQTQVVYYRDEDAAAAGHLAAALGDVPVSKASEPIGVVDVTIVVGADFEPPPD